MKSLHLHPRDLEKFFDCAAAFIPHQVGDCSRCEEKEEEEQVKEEEGDDERTVVSFFKKTAYLLLVDFSIGRILTRRRAKKRKIKNVRDRQRRKESEKRDYREK